MSSWFDQNRCCTCRQRDSAQTVTCTRCTLHNLQPYRVYSQYPGKQRRVWFGCLMHKEICTWCIYRHQSPNTRGIASGIFCTFQRYPAHIQSCTVKMKTSRVDFEYKCVKLKLHIAASGIFLSQLEQNQNLPPSIWCCRSCCTMHSMVKHTEHSFLYYPTQKVLCTAAVESNQNGLVLIEGRRMIFIFFVHFNLQQRIVCYQKYSLCNCLHYT